VQDRIANHADRAIAAIYDLHSYDNEAQTWLQSWANHLDRLATERNVDADTKKVLVS
jgi:hypothetical protein